MLREAIKVKYFDLVLLPWQDPLQPPPFLASCSKLEPGTPFRLILIQRDAVFTTHQPHKPSSPISFHKRARVPAVGKAL